MSILMVTGIEGARNCAEVVAKQLGMDVEVAEGRKAALAVLRQKEFAAVVIDETIADCDPAAAEAIWERAGLAIPLQINFALSGAARLIRDIRAALHRRDREQMLARRAATQPACCCNPNWPFRAARLHRRWPNACAWWPIWPATCAASWPALSRSAIPAFDPVSSMHTLPFAR